LFGVAQAQEGQPDRVSSDQALVGPQQTVDTQQTAKPPSPSEGKVESEPEKTPSGRGSFIIAPLPISSPALGTGIVPVVGYIFKLWKNDKSSPSVLGAVGLATDNGSRGFGTFADLFMKDDAYRITALYVRGNLNYDFYGVGFATESMGRKFPLEHDGQLFRAEISRRLIWRFFLGVRFWDGSSIIVPRGTATGDAPPDIELHTGVRALGLHLKRETTPNRFYPTTGTLLEFSSDFFSQALGSKYSFQAYRFVFNKYGSLSRNQVLAYNLFVCGTGGEPPFYGNCIYGTNNELRGYTAGQYLDRYMFATQLEYRLTLPWRFGLVGFGGVGEVAPSVSEAFRANDLLPGGGGGIRFQLSKKHHVNLRTDFARGKDTWTWSMGVGEAF
jgi:hypothetical protein